jgi:hypothetical protein
VLNHVIIAKMIIVNYIDLWIVYSHVARLLDGVRLELRELKSHSLLICACTNCPLLRSDLEASAVEIKDLKHKLNHSSHYSVLSPSYELCGSLKDKFFYATKENTQLKQEVASKKMMEDDLSHVKESATKSTYKLGTGFERCEDKGEKSAPKFVPTSNYHKEEEAIKATKTHYPSSLKSSFNPKREVRKEIPKSRENFCVHVLWLCWSLGRVLLQSQEN